MGKLKRRKLANRGFGKSTISTSKCKNNQLLPDLGLHLISIGLNQPFIFQTYTGFIVREDMFLGHLITGTTIQFRCSVIDNNPIPFLAKVYMFSIYLGNISVEETIKVCQKFSKSGIAVVPREDEKYTVKSDIIVPLKYLPSLS